MNELERYARLPEKLPREFCLLQGTGCRWKRCTFCDYHEDISKNPFAVNKPVLSRVTGEFGVLDIINSGSCVELDEETLALIKAVVQEKGIHTLWFECHYIYKDKLADFAARFPGMAVKFRIGVESFSGMQRALWHKGMPAKVTAEELAQDFSGVCLLFGVEGQRREDVSLDIELALTHFEYVSVNAFVENSTGLKRDEGMVDWFMKTWYPRLKDDKRVEVLLHNTDLGVG